MDIETKNNLKLRGQVIDLGFEISGDIDHGECFYEKEMLEEFCDKLDKMKTLAREYYISNKKDMEAED